MNTHVIYYNKINGNNCAMQTIFHCKMSQIYIIVMGLLCFQLYNRCFILYKKKSLIWMGHMQEYNSMLCDWILTLRIQWGVWQCFKPWGFSNSLSSSFIWQADFFFFLQVLLQQHDTMIETICLKCDVLISIWNCSFLVYIFQYTYIVVNNWTCCISNHMYLVVLVSFNANSLLKMLSS